MLQRLGDHIKACPDRTRAAAGSADKSKNPTLKAEHSEMARRWRHLARSYEFIESLERFLLDAQRAKGACKAFVCPDCGKPMRLAGAEPDEHFINLDQYHFMCDCGQST